MEIKMYATLRRIIDGKSVEIDADNITVGEAIELLFEQYPDLRKELIKANGDMHSAFHFFVNGRDARYLNGMETVIGTDDDVRIFPPVGGG